MFGLNRYRCFEVAWLQPDGCPAGGIWDVQSHGSIHLDTFAIKHRLEALHIKRCDDIHQCLETALRGLPYQTLTKVNHATETPEEFLSIAIKLPLRTICPISQQPQLALVCATNLTPNQVSMLSEYLAAFDDKSIAVESAADQIYPFCNHHFGYSGPLLVSAARRGGIAIAALRSSNEELIKPCNFQSCGIE